MNDHGIDILCKYGCPLDVKNKVKMINLERFLQSHAREGRTMCIIGNATITKPYGEEIDAHDFVTRLNHFILLPEHYETNGSKTTFISQGNRGAHRPGAICINCHPKKSEREYIMEPDHNCAEELLPEIIRPTTGALTIQAMLNIFDEVHIYGFDWMKTPHYFDGMQAERVWKHNYEVEEEYFREKEGVIIHECE